MAGSYRWVVVGVSTAVNALAWGGRSTFALFYVALLEEFGWGRGPTAAGYSLSWLCFVVFGPLAGRANGRDDRRLASRRGLRADGSYHVAHAVLRVFRRHRRRRDRRHDHSVDGHCHTLVRPIARHGDGNPQRRECGQRSRVVSSDSVAHRDGRLAHGLRRLWRRYRGRHGIARASLSGPSWQRRVPERPEGRNGRALPDWGPRCRGLDAPASAAERAPLGGVRHDLARGHRLPDHGDSSGRSRGGSGI